MAVGLKRQWKTFKTAAWLGWQMESNWTQPFLFATYSILKPIAATMILVLMYWVVISPSYGNAPENEALFSFLYIGNAFYMFVAQMLFGIFRVIQGDREWYQTIRNVYIAPMSYYVYVVARALTQVVIAGIAVIITLLFGVFVLDVQITLAIADVPLLLAILIIGLVGISSMGVILGGLSFLTAKHVHGMNESVAGIFYLFCGVLFPISMFPIWGQNLSLAIPLTYWFEAIRRIMAPETLTLVTPLTSLDMASLLLILLASTIVLVLISYFVFKGADYLARKKGLIDMITSY
ncbi:MAG: ABC transporter permease [Thermoplasmata archaeon]|nr:ABC transporter permease [Thermoplasmata archaeon]